LQESTATSSKEEEEKEEREEEEEISSGKSLSSKEVGTKGRKKNSLRLVKSTYMWWTNR